MPCGSLESPHEPLVEQLFCDVFARPKGADKGSIVGTLVSDEVRPRVDDSCPKAER